MKEIIKESMKNNYIGYWVWFNSPYLLDPKNKKVKGFVIDQDDFGYAIKHGGVVWNVAPSQQLEIVSLR